MATFGERVRKGWNAFRDNTNYTPATYGQYSSSFRPDRRLLTNGNERTIINAIYTRLAQDCAGIKIEHVNLDQNGRYIETRDSALNRIFNLEANRDQTGRDFLMDIYLSLFDEGVIALVPTITDDDPLESSSFGITAMRTGKILEWYPTAIRVRVYDEDAGIKKDIVLPKTMVGIIENPFYSIMNDRNSVLQRLVRKLNLLDTVDEQSSSGKLDLIIQLPYVIKSDSRKQQAEERRKQIEEQLSGTKYGIAYTDGTERITQLNRAVENNMMSQIEYLTNLLFSQLGLTEDIMNGTANEATMLNYYNRTIEPIVSTVVNEGNRKFLTKTARSQKQSLMYFRDPFKLVPINNIAEIADKFTRNEILSSNEVRGLIGFKPVDDQKADELRNKNINSKEGQEFASTNDEITKDQNLESGDRNDYYNEPIPE